MLKILNGEDPLLPKPTQNPKPNKNENHDIERGDPLCSDIPEWLQEFRENLVDDRVPELNGSSRIRAKQKLLKKHKRSLQKLLEPDRKPQVIYTDNSLEFGKACEDLSWNHCTSTPHRSETNGIAERAVRRVKEGTSAELLQSGLNESWWADSMECYTHLRNIQDLLSDGKTPYERRFGQPFKGPIIPFVSLVEYHPISAKDQSRIHQFGKKVLPGLVLGYA